MKSYIKKYKIINAKKNKNLIDEEIDIKLLKNKPIGPMNNEVASKQFVIDKIDELDNKLSNKIEQSQKATFAYVDNKINELDVKLSNQINELDNKLSKRIDNLETKINTQEHMLEKLLEHFNLK